MAENSLVEIRKYLETPDRPLPMKEFTDFWRSLSEEEKTEYKNADLGK